MSNILPNILNQISTTSGFLIFCSVIALSYACIWFLFLFEDAPKKKAQPAQGAEKGAEAAEAGKDRGKKKPEKKPERKPAKQPA